jgi:glycosyltransferase involved in cell wall biosynthesis
MRITIATGPWLPVPPLRGGSVPRMWMGLAEAFARRGNEVTIVARSFKGQPAREVLRGVGYLRFGGNAQGRWIAFALLKDFVYAIRVALRLPQSDILVTNSFWLPVIAAAVAPAAGRIVVNANRFPKGQYRLYRGAACIAAASDSVRHAIVRECPPLAGRTLIIPNIVDETFLRPARPGRRQAGRKTLLYVGRIHPEKGVHLLVDAFAGICAEHDDWRLRIIGPALASDGGGGPGYLEGLRATAKGRPIEFHDPIFDPATLADAYRECDLFCYPSLADRGEAFPVAPLEAMACGLPVVTSAIDCLSEIVSVGETGWIFDHRGAGAVEVLRGALLVAMKVPARLHAMGAKAAEFARRFSCEQIASRYLLEFDRLVNQGTRDA